MAVTGQDRECVHAQAGKCKTSNVPWDGWHLALALGGHNRQRENSRSEQSVPSGLGLGGMSGRQVTALVEVGQKWAYGHMDTQRSQGGRSRALRGSRGSRSTDMPQACSGSHTQDSDAPGSARTREQCGRPVRNPLPPLVDLSLAPIAIFSRRQYPSRFLIAQIAVLLMVRGDFFRDETSPVFEALARFHLGPVSPKATRQSQLNQQ